MNTLFTVGHSNHAAERFLELLSSHGVSTVVDVRSSPYSQYAPQFTKAALQEWLAREGVEYWFLGRELGARREEESCYVNDQARYELVARLPIFRRGLEKVVEGTDRRVLALMCSESDPVTCHRTILICRALKRDDPGMGIRHILADGSVETHEALLERLVAAHKLQPELFGELNSMDGLVERAYDLQAERIAYKRNTVDA